MKSIEEFKIPENLKQILKEEEIWEDDTFDPIYIRVMNDYFQLEFTPTDFDEISEILEDNGLDGDGYSWEDLLRNFIKTKDKQLEGKVKGDSEGETCVLWVQTEEDFRKLLSFTMELVNNPENAKAIISR